jgi:hypothetical protein
MTGKYDVFIGGGGQPESTPQAPSRASRGEPPWWNVSRSVV